MVILSSMLFRYKIVRSVINYFTRIQYCIILWWVLTLLAVVRKPANRPAVSATIHRDLARIQEWCNHWCIILNPNKTKALVVSRSRTVSPPQGDLVLSGVSIRASPNLDILGMKFDRKLTFEDHVHGIVFHVSQRIVIFRLVKRIFLDNSVLLRCYFAFVLLILEYCSPVWGSAAEGLQLLERLVYSVARLCPDQSFLRWVINVVLMGLVCCTRLMRTLITVCSACFHLLLLEFAIHELRPLLIHCSLKYQGVELPILQGVSCRPRFECLITSPSLCSTPERWMGSRAQSESKVFIKKNFLHRTSKYSYSYTWSRLFC